MTTDSFELTGEKDLVKILFAENPALVIQVSDTHRAKVEQMLEESGCGFRIIGRPVAERKLTVRSQDGTLELDIDAMRDVWFHTSYLLDCESGLHQPWLSRLRFGGRKSLLS